LIKKDKQKADIEHQGGREEGVYILLIKIKVPERGSKRCLQHL